MTQYVAANNAYSTLAGSLTDSDTTLTVQTGHGDRYPVITNGVNHTIIDLEDASNHIERVKVTARAGASDSMTIVRAQEGTTARAWNAGDIVECRPTAGAMNDKASLTSPNTLQADQTLAENSAIVLDAALSADGKYTGIVQAGTAAAALAFGELCYKVTASGKWNKAKADAAATSNLQLGLCVLAASGDAQPTTMLMYGNCRADALFDTFTVGAALYISAATAGKIVSAAPSGTTDFVVRKVGMAEDGNTIFFNPSNDYLTLA